jgi:hypothetical protein
VDYKTRAFGNTRHHLFGRTHDDITAIRRIAKLQRLDTDRRVVAGLAKSAGDVELAFGSASKIAMQGSNFNEKVSHSALLLPTQCAHVDPCFPPDPPPPPPETTVSSVEGAPATVWASASGSERFNDERRCCVLNSKQHSVAASPCFGRNTDGRRPLESPWQNDRRGASRSRRGCDLATCAAEEGPMGPRRVSKIEI